MSPAPLLGLGFGPSNLAIAICLLEKGDAPHGVEFIEYNDKFKWHPGMMIKGSHMQISFLKDLVTLRNPTSSFSFLNYLHENTRLLSFINLSTFTPSRREFNDYLSWAAGKVVREGEPEGKIKVHYGESVSHVKAVLEREGEEWTVNTFKVISRNKEGDVEREAKNLVVSLGGYPSIPKPFQAFHTQSSSPVSEETFQVYHTSQYLDVVEPLLKTLFPTPSMGKKSVRIAVVGAGQSSAEVFINLHDRISELSLPEDATVHVDLFIRQTSLRPSDDSPFANEIFNPNMTDLFYELGEGKEVGNPLNVLSLREEGLGGIGDVQAEGRGESDGNGKAREKLLKEMKATNYSVVNAHTLQTLYETMYNQKLETKSQPKLRILPNRKIVSVSTSPDCSRSLIFDIHNSLFTNAEERIEYDAVFLGTGYKRDGWKGVLGLEVPAFDVTEEKAVMEVGLSEIFPQFIEPIQTSEVSPTPSSSSSSSRNSAAGDSDEDERLLSQSHLTNITTPSSFAAEESKRVSPSPTGRDWKVSRNYQLLIPRHFQYRGRRGTFKPTVWLQGSNQATHGISDTLLSVISIRSQEMVDGFFKNGHFE
ncbi:hypothetical protein BT69DRAFT_1246449 [Atractiella rhizophila]|nr:hypothetical protein BT69DRAFT_1246449 [Atractiella rhizophila]